MRKFARTAIVVGLLVAIASAVLIGSLRVWIDYKTTQVKSFYQAHRLLNELRAVQEGSHDFRPAREALLQILPLGTDRGAAVAMLHEEGLNCQTVVEPTAGIGLRQSFIEARHLTNIPDENPTMKSRVQCQVETPDVLGNKHWIVDLELDANGHVGDARVTVTNIFL